MQRTTRSARTRLVAIATALLLAVGTAGPAFADPEETPTGTISGMVTSDGLGVSDVEIRIFSTPDVIGYTGQDGSYSITLPYGFYMLTPTAPQGYLPQPTRFVSIDASTPAVTVDVELVAMASGTSSITGSVTDRDTELPVSGARANLVGESVTYREQIDTASDGGFVFDELAAGTYTLDVWADGYVVSWQSLTVDDATTRIVDITLAAASSTITGTVVDALGDPVAFEAVSAEPLNQTGAGSVGLTDEDGTFEITGVSSGPYTVYVGGTGTSWTYASATTTVPFEGIATVSLTTSPRSTATIGGRVANLDDGTILNVCVSAFDATTGDFVDGTVAGSDPIDHGFFLELEAGDYLVHFQDCDLTDDVDYASAFYGGAIIPDAAEVVTVTASEDLYLEQILLESGSFGGTIQVDAGDALVPLPDESYDAVTVLTDFEGDLYEVEADVELHEGTSEYSVSGLAPGTYTVLFEENFEGPRAFTPQFWPGVADADAAEPITIASDIHLADIDAVLSFAEPNANAVAVPTAELDGLFEDRISASPSVPQASTVTLQVPLWLAGEWVSVWAHSSPTQLGGWVKVPSTGIITATVPLTLGAGNHSIAVQHAEDGLVGWTEFAVTLPAGTATTTPPAPVAAKPAPATTPAAGNGSAPKPLTLAGVQERFGADTAQLLARYLADTGRAVPPTLEELFTIDGTVDLSDFEAWLAWTTDETVQVYGYSTPTLLGTFASNEGGLQLSGLDLTALGEGEHHLLLIGETTGTSKVVGFENVAAAVTDAPIAEEAEEPKTTEAVAASADEPASFPAWLPIAAGALALLVLVIGANVILRRRLA